MIAAQVLSDGLTSSFTAFRLVISSNHWQMIGKICKMSFVDRKMAKVVDLLVAVRERWS